MAEENRRRNGLYASCEPCRAAKVRCDHKKPVCSRCQRRRGATKCWYHPAPLTRANTRQAAVRFFPKPSPPPPTPSPVASATTAAVAAAAEPGKTSTSLNRNPYPIFSTIIAVDKDASPDSTIFHLWPFMPNDGSTIQPRSLSAHPTSSAAFKDQLRDVETLVGPLQQLDAVEKHVKEYFDHSQIVMVPKPLVMRMLELLKEHLASLRSGGGLDYKALARVVLRNTMTAIAPIESDMSPEGFCNLLSGSNLRVESLGVFYALAARAIVLSSGQVYEEQGKFISELVRCSHLSLRLAREATPQINDAIIWLADEDVQLVSHIEGEASLAMWRAVSELSNDIVALGLHCEASYSNLPFFLAQSRRRVFMTVNRLEKSCACLFQKPPRLPHQYTDCDMPLDLSDEDIYAFPNGPESRFHQSVTSDGWNKNGEYQSVTWTRMRYVMGQFREEMLNVQIRNKLPQDSQLLRDLAIRCDAMWNSLPQHLRYHPDCWTSVSPAEVGVMLSKTYLLYLHIHFQIHQLLGKLENKIQPGIYAVSATIVETVVQRATVRNTMLPMARDVPGMILCYGFPCALLLGNAMRKDLRHPSQQQFPESINRPKLIRNMSILVSQFENVANEQHVNREFCLQAATGLAKILDEVLDLQFKRSPTPSTSTRTPVSEVLNTPENLDTGVEPMDFSQLLNGQYPAQSLVMLGDYLENTDGLEGLNWGFNEDWTLPSIGWNPL